jgi:uncharacterized protein YycO
MRNSILVSVTLAASVGLGGCVTNWKSVTVHRPVDQEIDQTVTQMWADEVRAVAQDGDWILSRSYYFVGDVISTLTSGEDLSHASIYSAKTGTVIEAVTPVVREIPLEQLIQRNHYIIVVRPNKLTAAERSASVARARGKVGVKFDTRGMFGFDNPDTFYCSELVYWAADVGRRFGESQTVITPPEMMSYGQVVYWSGQRDDAQVMHAAAAHIADQDDLAVRAAATKKRLAAR